MTPKAEQEIPLIDHQNKKRSTDFDFFKMPNNIGRLISAESNYNSKEDKLSGNDLLLHYFKYIGVSILISIAIIFLGDVENEIWLAVWIIVPNGLSIWLKGLIQESSL